MFRRGELDGPREPSRNEEAVTHLSLIQSVQNSMVKYAYSLKVPKKSKLAEDFLCEGFHLVQEAQKSRLKTRFIFATRGAWEREEGKAVFSRAQRDKVRCFEVAPKIISYLTDTAAPQGITAVVAKPAAAWPQEPFSTVLAVHQVQDAGNMGTLLRSAEAFGVGGIFLTEGSCDLFNPKVVRASMGSLFRVPFMQDKNWNDYAQWFRQNGFHSYALALGASTRPLTEVNFPTPLAFWVGAEGAGLPEELVQSCEGGIQIPMLGQVESLNVGVAASVALFWARFGRPVS